ncbi:MAG: hypothetical protein HKP16_01765 [Xanthomonadales bacterium]|nr:hypothetical protein [Xanthomonadales bacterium]
MSHINWRARLFSALCAALIANILLTPTLSGAYPLDGEETSGIRRLQGYLNAQAQGVRLPAGALLGLDDIGLRLEGMEPVAFDEAPQDEDLQTALAKLLKNRDPSYSVVVIDYSDPDDIRWGAVRPDIRQNAGSVGKILCMLALFDGLARAFPDPVDRARILRETVVPGGDWVLGDTHDVPHYNPATGRNRFAVIQPRDEFRLSEWLDHMVSPSANAAGAVVWREAMLLRHFGDAYPVSSEQRESFFRDSRPSELRELALAVIAEPLAAAGIDTGSLQQGSFWTYASKRKVPGTSSFATTRELARFLFNLEQGRLVDEWSSLEMKRYLYTTKRRYRYVYAPELNNSAVYFKSGSLYKCKAEEDFVCRKYHGNVWNMMNSVAIVESPAGVEPQRRYVVALMSNVLRQNSAWDHSRIAAAIERLLTTGAAATIQEKGTEKEITASGQG